MPSIDELCDMVLEMGFDDASRVRPLIEKKLTRKLGLGWSIATWRCWVKNRAMEVGIPSFFSDPDMSHATAVLHVFPLSYTEDDEGLKRVKTDGPVAPSGPSRSKICKYTKTAKPIDSVARRVAPTDGMDK